MDKITSAYEWIKKNIESSNSPFHVEGCKRLMQLFIEMYGKGELEENQLTLVLELESELTMLLMNKENTINYF